MSLDLLIEILPAFLRAAWLTLWLSVAAIASGAALGFGMNAALQLSPRLGTVYSAFVWVVRGTPFLAQLFVLYFGFPQIGVTMDALTAAIVGLTIYGSAYFAEIFRTCWQSIPRGQIEAGSVFGMSRLSILRHIEWPQAGRLAVPMLVNQAILILKESSVVSIITVPELTMTAGTVVADTFSYLEPYLLLGLIYWLMALALAAIGRATEHLTKLSPRKEH